MLVNNLYLKNVKIGPPELPAENAAGVRVTRSGSPASAGQTFLSATAGKNACPTLAGSAASDCVHSDELRHLMSLAHQEPEVRRDRLEEVGRLLASGNLFSHSAAVETAEAMLNSDG